MLFFTSIPYIYKDFNFLKSILIKKESIDGKKYHCPFISNDGRNGLKILSDLISDLKKIRNESDKSYDESINNCGTDKEYDYSPEVDSLIPPDIQSLLDEYHKTKTYTIKEFQECRKFWGDEKKKAYEEQTKGIDEIQNELNKELSANNCKLIAD